MIPTLLAFVALVTISPMAESASATSLRPGNSTTEETAGVVAEVQARFDELVSASKTLNVENFMKFVDPEKFVGLDQDGTVLHSASDFEATYRKSVATIQHYVNLEFHNVKISVINQETVILVNEYRAEVVLRSGDTVSAVGGGSQVWSKAGGTWLLVSVSSSG